MPICCKSFQQCCDLQIIAFIELGRDDLNDSFHPIFPPPKTKDVKMSPAKGYLDAGNHERLTIPFQRFEGFDRVVVSDGVEFQSFSFGDTGYCSNWIFSVRTGGVNVEITPIPTRFIIINFCE